MTDKQIKTKKGFTIIEVVLVLAVAGLIFLMAFIAFPALRSGQRDTQRRDDMASVNNALVNYQTNNATAKNNLPAKGKWSAVSDGTFGASCSGVCAFVRDYLNSVNTSGTVTNNFKDPDGAYYNVIVTENYATTGTINVSDSAIGSAKLKADGTGTDSGYIIDGGAAVFKEHAVFIIPGGKCSGEKVIKAEKNSFAIMYRMERAGVYCVDSK